MPTTPNLQQSLTQLDITMSVSCKLSGNRDLISQVIKSAIKSSVPCSVILSTIKDMATDNRCAIEGLIGRELTQKIMQL